MFICKACKAICEAKFCSSASMFWCLFNVLVSIHCHPTQFACSCDHYCRSNCYRENSIKDGFLIMGLRISLLNNLTYQYPYRFFRIIVQGLKTHQSRYPRPVSRPCTVYSPGPLLSHPHSQDQYIRPHQLNSMLQARI